MPILGQHSFRMKLNPENGEFFVVESHNYAVAGARIDIQFMRQIFFTDHQRMVTCHPIEGRKPAEQTLPAVVDETDFSVHGALSALNGGAENTADNLMSQADSENRNPTGHSANQLLAERAVVRPLRTWGDNDSFQFSGPCKLFNLCEIGAAAPYCFYLRAAFLHVAGEIVYKRIIMVNHQIHNSKYFLSDFLKASALREMSGFWGPGSPIPDFRILNFMSMRCLSCQSCRHAACREAAA